MKNKLFPTRKAIYSSFFIFHSSLLFFLLLSCEACPTPGYPELKNGDLLFTLSNAEAGTLSDAIVGATSHEAMPIDHVAIMCTHNHFLRRGRESLFVLEATTGDGVRICPLDTFLVHADHNAEGKPLVLVGRIEGDFDRRTSLRKAKSFLGRRYDEVYSPTDDDIYCSELVQKSYVDHKGNPLFSPEPMSFHGADGQILPFWTEFYSSRDLPVPEGEPGSNPASIAAHPAVRIVGRFF
jgi:hypothetical protein